MNIIRRSTTSFVKYKAIDKVFSFKSSDGKGGYASSDKCTWTTNEFYLAEDFRIVDANISFESKALSSVAEKLATSAPVDFGVVFQKAEGSYLDAYMFDMGVSAGKYSYSGLLLEFNLLESEIASLIDAINSGKWKDIEITIFIDEIELLRSLNESEPYNFANYSSPMNNFLINY